MRRGRVALPSLAAGVLVALSVPPFGWWALAAFGLGGLAWRLAGLPARGRLLAGLLFGIGMFGPTLVWMTAFNAAGYGAVVVLEAAFFALAALVVPPGRGRALAFPTAITLAEAARSAWPLGGLPMGGIPLGQAGGPLLPAARLGGFLLVTGLAATAGVVLAEAAHAIGSTRSAHPHRLAAPGAPWPRRQRWAFSPPLAGPTPPGHVAPGRGRGHAGAALVAAGLMAAILGGAVPAPAGGPALSSLRVAAVQGGGPRGLRAIYQDPTVVYRAELLPTEALHPPLDLVLWPENVIALDQPVATSPVVDQVGRVARALGTTLVAGVTIPVGRARFLNQAVAWAPSGQVVGTYEKVHRVPFGEYVPGRSFLRHVVNLSDVPRDAIPGHGPGLLPTPAGPLGVMISYEVFFASRARAAVAAGGQLLVVPTDTASYTSSLVPTQEVAADRLRAVEEGRDLVQASPTGYDTMVDARGQVLARSRLGGQQVIEGTLSRRGGRTLYSLAGDLPELALGGAMLVAAWALTVATRRRRPTPRSCEAAGAAEPASPLLVGDPRRVEGGHLAQHLGCGLEHG